jgi:O-acetyl-ADP-ribose deacetylase (regulator of RNase III)
MRYDPSTLPLGTKLKDYEVWGRLGEGGMSEVWLAKHSVLCVPVIIKTLRAATTSAKNPCDIGGADGAHRMLNEARLMARVTSPRVVRAVDAGTHEGTPYLVQEYVDGLDLAELDRRRRAALGVGLPLWFVAYAMREICSALHAAHQAGVIHRDVKPSNVFGSPDAGIRLGDFGIAIAHEECAHPEVSGTIKFMAPEQLRGGTVDRFTDVYGAGATACDLRYGHAPFSDVDSILDDTRAPNLPPPASPAEAYFQHTIRQMLAKDPGARPDDPEEARRHFATLYDALRSGRAHAPFSFVDKNTFRLGGCVISFYVGDLARENVDAIVSSANSKMTMRSGCADALRIHGGDAIEMEALKAGDQALGSCIATTAGSLAAKHVLHAVSAWNEASCVGRAMHHALLLADELGCKSLAFPALGTGSARVSIEMCANAMMTALSRHIAFGGTRLEHVRIVLGSEEKLRTYRAVAEEALRENETGARPIVDLGLPVEEGEVRVDGATHLDAMSHTSD